MRNLVVHSFLVTVFIAGYHSLCSQPADTVFSYAQFIQQVIEHHPVARQAELKAMFGNLEIRRSRGNFDPILGSSIGQKEFNDKLYYRQIEASVRIPTYFGVDIVGGYDMTAGEFLNPEQYLPTSGLWHAGLELNLLQGLLVNERNTALKRAKAFERLSINEQQLMLNELIYDATNAYLQWQLYYFFEIVLKENQSLAFQYFENSKRSFNAGEKTALDTLEAMIGWQDADLALQKNKAELAKARFRLDNFLWFERTPIGLQSNSKPEDFTDPITEIDRNVLDSLLFDLNPSIQLSMNKLSMLEIDQRLKREKLKPKLAVKFNPLLEYSGDSAAPIYSAQDYRFGVQFSMPLLFRTERADVQQNNVKIEELELDIEYKRNVLRNKLSGTIQVHTQLDSMQVILEENVQNYRKLLEGETEKFRLGESSVFLLNKRQEKYISSRLKLVENQIKLKEVQLDYLYYTNQLVSL